MKRTYRFVEQSGSVVCSIDGVPLDVPVFGGILKHPTIDQLDELLRDPVVVRKYTREALRLAPWCALRKFPRSLLIACLRQTALPDGRRRAVELMLDLDAGARDPPTGGIR
jgi:hypothetical protein